MQWLRGTPLRGDVSRQPSCARPLLHPQQRRQVAAAARNAKRLKYAGVGQRLVVGEPLFVTVQVG